MILSEPYHPTGKTTGPTTIMSLYIYVPNSGIHVNMCLGEPSEHKSLSTGDESISDQSDAGRATAIGAMSPGLPHGAPVDHSNLVRGSML